MTLHYILRLGRVRRYESFRTLTLVRLLIPWAEEWGEVGLCRGQKNRSDAGNSRFRAASSKTAFEFAKRASETRVRAPLEPEFSGLQHLSSALIFGVIFRAQCSLSELAPDNTDVMTERIRKTNLSLQTISINSNTRRFAPNARPYISRIGRYALPTARFARQALAVEWKIYHHALNVDSSVDCHITVCCKAYSPTSAQ